LVRIRKRDSNEALENLIPAWHNRRLSREKEKQFDRWEFEKHCGKKDLLLLVMKDLLMLVMTI
jgi:hypothetical protein